MAIETATQRRQVPVVRRLPWTRRFTVPAPDSVIAAGDRCQLGFKYVIRMPGNHTIVATQAFSAGAVAEQGYSAGALAVQELQGDV